MAKCISVSMIALVAASAAPAFAQESNEVKSSGIEEIVVTATRQSESLQSVPVAVTALSGESLEKSNVVNLQDVSNLTPGMRVMPQFKPGDAVYQIRGQIQVDTASTIDPSVGVYFDDVYIARSSGSLVNLIDVERVEVLKGPQGTLFGKNTTGGAIRIISNKPTDYFEGYGKVGYESFDRYTLEGVVNAPLADTLAMRVAGQYTKKTGGYATNFVTGNKIDTDETGSIRAALKWEPSDRVTVNLMGDYTKIDAGGFPNFLGKFVPTGSSAFVTALTVALESGLGPDIAAGTSLLLAESQGSGSRVVGANGRAVDTPTYSFDPTVGLIYNEGPIDPYSNVETWGMMGNIEIELGAVSLKSITAYREVKSDYLYDVDGTQYVIANSHQFNDSYQFSQEVLLNGVAFDDRLDWTVGGIYFYESPTSRDLSVSLAALTFPSRGTDTTADATNISYGGFAQGTFSLTDQLSFTAGARYSWEKRSFDVSAFSRFANGTPDACAYTVANGLALQPGFSAPCTISQSAPADGELSYVFSLNYQIDPSKLVYLKTSRGYRAGGFNPRVNVPEVLGSFKPEIVTDYEFGLKADWLERALRTNLAVFYSKGTDVQNTLNGTASTGGTFTRTVNAGTRKIKGFEFDMIVKPAPWLQFDAGVAYLHARNYDPAQPDYTSVEAVSPWTVNVGAEVDTPLGDSLEGTLRVSYAFRDEYKGGAPIRNAAGAVVFDNVVRDVGLLGARYTLKHLDSGISLSVYGRNLTNEIYESRSYTIGSLGLALGNVAEPRVVGIELKVPFGAAAGR